MVIELAPSSLSDARRKRGGEDDESGEKSASKPTDANVTARSTVQGTGESKEYTHITPIFPLLMVHFHHGKLTVVFFLGRFEPLQLTSELFFVEKLTMTMSGAMTLPMMVTMMLPSLVMSTAVTVLATGALVSTLLLILVGRFARRRSIRAGSRHGLQIGSLWLTR